MDINKIHKQRLVILILAIIGVISAFLPWATTELSVWGASYRESINGIQGDGMISFLAFIAAGVIAVLGNTKQTVTKDDIFKWGTVGAGGVAALIALIAMMNVSSVPFTSAGFGIFPSILAGGAIAAVPFLDPKIFEKLPFGADGADSSSDDATTESNGNQDSVNTVSPVSGNTPNGVKKMELGQLNRIAGILAIIGAAIFPLAFWFIAAAVVGDAVGTAANIAATGDVTGLFGGFSRPAIAWVFDAFALISLALFIYTLNLTKKANLEITGHILGIIGTAFFIISPIFPGIVAMILLILAAVFLMKVSKKEPLAGAAPSTADVSADNTTDIAE